jgi:hypothetical protein
MLLLLLLLAFSRRQSTKRGGAQVLFFVFVCLWRFDFRQKIHLKSRTQSNA